jgi:LPS export ABC transporter protein LptC
VAFFITRRQSFLLGIGLLGTFFTLSGAIVYSRNKSRIPTSTLSKELIEGASTALPALRTPTAQITPEGVSSIGSSSGFVLNEFHRSLVKDGKVMWEVFGRRGEYNPLSHNATVQEPQLKLYDEKNGDVQIQAKRAELTLSISELSQADLHDKVVITHKADTTIKTNHATYNRAANTVDIPAPFELEHPAFTLLGSRLHADITTQVILITNGVQTTLKPKAGRQP